jgi:hypothetical protein
MGPACVLYERKDPADVARLLEAVLSDGALEQAIVSAQDAALDRLRRKDFAGTLLRFVDQVLQAPPRPGPEVAFDFWAQFDQFERLEELRQYRPALYRALPSQPRPAARGPLPETHPSEPLPADRDPQPDRSSVDQRAGPRTADRGSRP